MAQLAEEKRHTAEAKLAARAKARGEEEEEEETPGVSSMSGNVVGRKPLSATTAMPVEEDEDEDVPALLDSDLPTLQAALDAADVFLEVVDARDIAGGRSAHVENLVSESDGKVWIVVNKVDLVPREVLEKWLAALPYPTYLFSAREKLGREQLLADLGKIAKKKGEEVKAALLGLPNVGKSSVLNALVGRDAARVAAPVPLSSQAKVLAPTTSQCIEYEATENIRIIDTPGWEYVEEEDEDEDEDEEMDEDVEENPEKWDLLEARVAGDLLRRNLGRIDRVKDVFPLASYIISRSNAQDLMLKYNVPFFEEGDIEAFMTGLARVNQRVKKFGEPNHDAAARILLRDWATNEFPYYTAPEGEAKGVAQPDNSKVLEACKSRKELKTARGLVRFRTSEVDEREVFLDDDYTAVGGDSDEEDDGDEDDVEDDDEEDDDEEDEEEAEGLLIGSDEGEELELSDGPEPTSPSSLDDEDDDESESEREPTPEPAGRKRKARVSLPSERKKAKTVSFKPKPEPKSLKRDVSNVKGILKRPAEPEESPKESRKRARAAEPEAKAEVKKAKKAVVKAQPKVEVKKTKSKGKASGEGEAYDFSQHF